MEGKWRWVLLTSIAPIIWGANYYVIHHYLPDVGPFWGATLRATPGGLVLLLLVRRLPHGSWWWKSLVLGVLNAGAFFLLVHLAAQRLPTSIASVVMAASPLAMMFFAWALISERLRLVQIVGGVLGIAGVCLMLLGGESSPDLLGVVASATAMTMSSLGFALTKRWMAQDPVPSLASTSWQLLGGGLLVLPFAVVFDRDTPPATTEGVLGLLYVALFAAALSYGLWFQGVQRLPAGQVSLLCLLNPVTGVLLGLVVADEVLSLRQAIGIVVVMVGVLLGQTSPRRRTHDTPDAPAGDGPTSPTPDGPGTGRRAEPAAAASTVTPGTE